MSPCPCSIQTDPCFSFLDVGLQTPRLKRLAEIVSAQAIAQQEKLEYPADDGDYDGLDGPDHHLAGVDETPEPVEASA
jgi:myosin V